MTRLLTSDELADEAGVTPDLVERLTEIEVIRPAEHGLHAVGDIIRVETVQSFLAAGFTLDQLAEVVEQGLFTFEYLDRFYPETSPMSALTPSQLADQIGIDPATLSSVYMALGLPDPKALREEEVAVIRRFVEVWSADPDAMVRAARLIGEPVRALSEGWTRLYVEKISAPLDSLEPEKRTAAIVATTERATQLAPRMLLWLLHRHMSSSIDRANIEGLEEVMARQGLVAEKPPSTPAVAFLDVSGFTSMIESLGDELAVVVSERLRRLSQETIRNGAGSVVKILGDGVMLYFPSARSAAASITDLVLRLDAEGLQAHAGIHAGPVVEHDGDIFGTTVNLASRVATLAAPGEVVLTDAAREGLDPMFDLEPMGSVELKGVSSPVQTFRLRVSSPGEPASLEN